jgi:predicted DNA binding protein
VRLRTEAGVDGYLDDVTISVDETDERSRGPTGRAFRTGAMQTTRHVGTDSRYGPWRDAADRYGFRSSAAIPIVHETTVYGVLNVYADRPNAFEGDEGEVLAQLGEIVGHAIAVEERKRALLSDEVVELEFRVEDVFGSLGLAVDDTGPIRLDHVVSIDDDYVLFGRTTPDGVETLRRLAESVPSYEEPTVRGDGDERRVELVVSDPPVLSTVASLGGSVEEARIEDGDYHLRVFLSPTVEVRRLVDAVSETFPDATLTKRRQRSRPTDSGRPGDPVLSEALTDRQRAAIESAYHAGFFEWPRAVSGEDVAETLDVTPPTFHQHLRKAEKRILDALLASSVGDTV